MFGSLINRFKSWLRAWLAESSVGFDGLPGTIDEAAKDLCERARAGDQNAIGMICEIRDNANRGEDRAKETHDAIGRYLKQNKAEVGSDPEADSMACEVLAGFGNEGETYEDTVLKKVKPLAQKDLKKAVVTVANGPSLIKGYPDLVASICESLPEQEQKALAFGAYRCSLAMQAMQGMSHECQHALLLGYVLGKARAIQIVRLPYTPIGGQSRIAGEELD